MAFDTGVLAGIPRVPLAQLPTPISPLPRLSTALGGPALFIKRDDQTGLATGGNKTRKLEYLMADALQAGADCVITAGSTQSNHARQTAAAARACGLEPHLVLYAPGGTAPAKVQGNILIDLLLGAVIHWTDERAPYTRTLQRVEDDLRAAGRRPYVAPYGGSNATGLLGYVNAMFEVAAQEAGQPFDAHVFATSSGGTQAGMLLGAVLAGVPGRLIGISVDERRADLAPRAAALANAGAEKLGVSWRIKAEDPHIIVEEGYLGGGYAVIGEAEREAIRLLAQSEGMLVDPVYTGRALAGLIDMVRRGRFGHSERVLFWHTGGAAALFAFADELGL